MHHALCMMVLFQTILFQGLRQTSKTPYPSSCLTNKNKMSNTCVNCPVFKLHKRFVMLSANARLWVGRSKSMKRNIFYTCTEWGWFIPLRIVCDWLLQISSGSRRELQQQGRWRLIIWCYQPLPNENKLRLHSFQAASFSLWVLILFCQL